MTAFEGLKGFEVLVESPDGPARLRDLVLTLAVRGQLVEQDPKEGSASELLKKITTEKSKLVKAGRIKKQKEVPPISDDEMPFQVPREWAWCRLAQLFLKITDGTHHSPPNGPHGAFPYVSAKHIKPEGILRKDITFVSAAVHAEIWSRCDPQSGDLLYIKDGATTGVVTVCDFDEPFSMLSSVGLLKTHAFLDAWFACFALRSRFFFDQMREQMSGVGIPRVTLGKLEAALLPVPPLAEQRRIVTRIKELMAWIDQFEASRNLREAERTAARDACLAKLCAAMPAAEVGAAWSTVASHFDTLFTSSDDVTSLRRSILQLAVRGKLVAQDPKDEPVSNPVQASGATSRATRSPNPDEPVQPLFDAPANWRWLRMDTITDLASGVTKGRNLTGRKTTALPYLRVANVQAGFLNLDVIKTIAVPDDEIDGELLLCSGDVLLTEGGDWDKLGRSAIWNAEITRCTHQNHVFRARPRGGITPEWISMFTNCPDGRAYFQSCAKRTTNLASINMTQLRACPVPMPPKAEQDRIVARVDELMGLLDLLEQRFTAALATHAAFADAAVHDAGHGLRGALP